MKFDEFHWKDNWSTSVNGLKVFVVYNLPVSNTRWRGDGWPVCNNIGPISFEVQVHNTKRAPAAFLHALLFYLLRKMSICSFLKIFFVVFRFRFSVVSIWKVQEECLINVCDYTILNCTKSQITTTVFLHLWLKPH